MQELYTYNMINLQPCLTFSSIPADSPYQIAIGCFTVNFMNKSAILTDL
jgi:hypothetical protein